SLSAPTPAPMPTPTAPTTGATSSHFFDMVHPPGDCPATETETGRARRRGLGRYAYKTMQPPSPRAGCYKSPNFLLTSHFGRASNTTCDANFGEWYTRCVAL